MSRCKAPRRGLTTFAWGERHRENRGRRLHGLPLGEAYGGHDLLGDYGQRRLRGDGGCRQSGKSAGEERQVGSAHGCSRERICNIEGESLSAALQTIVDSRKDRGAKSDGGKAREPWRRTTPTSGFYAVCFSSQNLGPCLSPRTTTGHSARQNPGRSERGRWRDRMRSSSAIRSRAAGAHLSHRPWRTT